MDCLPISLTQLSCPYLCCLGVSCCKEAQEPPLCVEFLVPWINFVPLSLLTWTSIPRDLLEEASRFSQAQPALTSTCFLTKTQPHSSYLTSESWPVLGGRQGSQVPGDPDNCRVCQVGLKKKKKSYLDHHWDSKMDCVGAPGWLSWFSVRLQLRL